MSVLRFMIYLCLAMTSVLAEDEEPAKKLRFEIQLITNYQTLVWQKYAGIMFFLPN